MTLTYSHCLLPLQTLLLLLDLCLYFLNLLVLLIDLFLPDLSGTLLNTDLTLSFFYSHFHIHQTGLCVIYVLLKLQHSAFLGLHLVNQSVHFCRHSAIFFLIHLFLALNFYLQHFQLAFYFSYIFVMSFQPPLQCFIFLH